MGRRLRCSALAAALALASASVFAQPPQQFADGATRYMALGDSIPAGYKVVPVTNGYPFRLYQDAVFDAIPNMLFNNASVAGATSADVLQYQVPQAVLPFALGGFNAEDVTLTVGGNDLLAILRFAEANPDPNAVEAFAAQQLFAYGQNLTGILVALRTGLPDAKIFVSNQYALPNIQSLIPIADLIVDNFNAVVQQVLSQFPTNVYLVDVHAAFLGRAGLIEGQRPNAPIVEVHPTNVGQRVIEQAFAAVIAVNK